MLQEGCSKDHLGLGYLDKCVGLQHAEHSPPRQHDLDDHPELKTKVNSDPAPNKVFVSERSRRVCQSWNLRN